jgi:hypothetical protein
LGQINISYFFTNWERGNQVLKLSWTLKNGPNKSKIFSGPRKIILIFGIIRKIRVARSFLFQKSMKSADLTPKAPHMLSLHFFSQEFDFMTISCWEACVSHQKFLCGQALEMSARRRRRVEVTSGPNCSARGKIYVVSWSSARGAEDEIMVCSGRNGPTGLNERAQSCWPAWDKS